MISVFIMAPVLATALIGWQPSPSLPMRWSATEMPIPYCILPNAQRTTVPAQAIYDAVESGITGWVSEAADGGLSCSTYLAVPASYACEAVAMNDGKHNIFWSQDWREGSATIGFTVSYSSGTSCGQVTDNTQTSWDLECKADADIVLNDVHYTWTTDGATGTDIASIVAHEYGHFIGLGHCDDNGTCDLGDALMYSAYPGSPIRTPRADDTLGACALYPGTSGGLGWPCTDGLECDSLLCVNPGPTGYCSTLCGTCPFGYACGADPSNPGRNLCVRDDGLNQPLCGTCLPVPNGCADDGLCVSGLTEAETGRCIAPCPQPSAGADGGCPTDYTCLTVQSSRPEQYCVPKSQNCDDLGAYDVVEFGAACDGSTVWCQAGLDCYGICSHTCTPSDDSSPPTTGCEPGAACETFSDGAGGVVSICVPAVSEGESCDGLQGCAVGPCLITAERPTPTCYLSCLRDANACNNAQQCTHATVGETEVAYCTPAGAPPITSGDAGAVMMDSGQPDGGATLDGGPVTDGGTGDGGIGDGDTADGDIADGSLTHDDAAHGDAAQSSDGADLDADVHPLDGGLPSDIGPRSDAASERTDGGGAAHLDGTAPGAPGAPGGPSPEDTSDELAGCACQTFGHESTDAKRPGGKDGAWPLSPWIALFAGLLLRAQVARRCSRT
ncbi:MAG: matrixin family metalloprotease [Deltaproteobacteria bacterium]|nr:matrixin family metalloprotease [Deltaproteobacteria bacterium]